MRPGKIGKPAASAEVHPSGRIWFESRLNTAPEPAVQPVPLKLALYSSYSKQLSLSSAITCLSPEIIPSPSTGASGGMGYGPGSLCSGQPTNVIGTFGCEPGTMT